MKEKRCLIVSIILFASAIIFTILVKLVDVSTLGNSQTPVGFATLNETVFAALGSDMTIYTITKILGIVPILAAIAYAIYGLVQWIKVKNLFKVDNKLLALGAVFLAALALYIFFETCVINYRPILIDGELKASYPSSHTVLALCFCGGMVLYNRAVFAEKNWLKIANVLLIVLAFAIVAGRLLSGAHWCSDIIGAMLFSSAILTLYFVVIKNLKN